MGAVQGLIRVTTGLGERNIHPPYSMCGEALQFEIEASCDFACGMCVSISKVSILRNGYHKLRRRLRLAGIELERSLAHYLPWPDRIRFEDWCGAALSPYTPSLSTVVLHFITPETSD